MHQLFTPWRLPYIMSLKPDAECVFCAAQRADDPAVYILYRGRHNFVILNVYPYSNGHLMIAPFQHLATPGDSEPAQRAELMDLAVQCQKALEQAYRPEGFNIGMNLGKCAGAGVLGHFHLHVVPRWSGDTNFMSVTGDTRVIPEDLNTSYKKLKSYFKN